MYSLKLGNTLNRLYGGNKDGPLTVAEKQFKEKCDLS